MNAAMRQPPYFVPTLTEVIKPSANNQATALPDARFVPTLTDAFDPQAISQCAPNPGLDDQALVATILQQVRPMLADWLQQESEQWLRATLAQQLQELNTRLQNELEARVRQAVKEALAPQNLPYTNSAPENY
jgi:hypothetical protein